MGIIINDTITLNNGLIAANIYCSFGEGGIRIEKIEIMQVNMM